jgi:hypothetical protein
MRRGRVWPNMWSGSARPTSTRTGSSDLRGPLLRSHYSIALMIFRESAGATEHS